MDWVLVVATLALKGRHKIMLAVELLSLKTSALFKSAKVWKKVSLFPP
jgi:hypothetical protein